MSKEKEILFVVEALSNEKDVPKEIIFEALEQALAMATKKLSHEDIDVIVEINQETGEYKTYRIWTVVDDDKEWDEFVESREIKLSDAKTKNPNLEIGEVIKEEIASVEFGRIAAQNARQVLLQKVRDAEKKKIAEIFQHKIGQIISGIVKRITRDFVFLDLGGNNAEAVISREELIPKEVFRPGDRIKAYLYDVKTDAKGPQIYLSRTHKGMLVELFHIEVPEIGEGIIEIMAAAREPGNRAKIAVKTKDARIDPIGACIGMRGSRVQAVSGELGGERIDIILWDDNPAQLVINSLAPAEVASIEVDEDKMSMDVAVNEEQLSQAIGRNGQNVKLASELTGWTLNVMSEKEAAEKSQAEAQDLQALFVSSLEVDEEIAQILIREGFTSIEEIAYVPLAEIVAIEEFDEEIVKMLREQAKNVLLTQALSGSQMSGSNPKPTDELLQLKGMTQEIAENLTIHGIVTREDLAEQSVDELVDLCDLDRDKAGELILVAREPWFIEAAKADEQE